MEMDYLSNEASTSSAMPMECRISQEYGQPQQYQPQQQQQGETQWIQMEQPSLMTQQHPQQMASVVYTSTSQQMPRIPDPGGQHTNHPQILNNYNPQQTQHIIQTGINGQTMLASMQPVQRIIPQQQQFELNSNNFMQQQVAYIDHTGSQQFITSQTGEVGNVNFHQMQVIPQIVPIQPAPAAETPAPAPIPPPTKAKATKNTSRAKKKNQPPPPQSQAPAEGDSILSKIEKTGSVAVNFNDNPEKSAKMAQLMGMMASLAANEAQGYDVSEARSSLEKQLEELLTGANIIPQPTPVAPPPKPASTYTPIAPNANIPSTSTPTPQQPKTKKGRTKAEQQQNLQQKKAANAAANANINSNIQPQVIQQPQQQPQNDSGCRIILQEANYLIVESNGTIMKAVNVRTENGTATYQILGPVDEQTLYQIKQSQQQPPPQQPPQSQHQQKRVQPIQPSTFKAENDEVAPAAVLDVVNSLSSSSKSKTQKKTPAKSRSKKVSEPPLPPAVEQKPVVIKEQEVLSKPKPEPTQDG
uniref:Uncharacterized protein n=1 Tax=Panagrolaimus davidi TaxID=227884 RepID=A0A914NXW9_9BILA